MSKHDLRAELDRLTRMIDTAPPDQSWLVAHTTTKREQDEQRLMEAATRRQQTRDLLASLEHGPARVLRRGDLARARAQAEQAEQAEQAYQVARQQADRAADRERTARHAQQLHEAHLEDRSPPRRPRATRPSRPRPGTRHVGGGRATTATYQERPPRHPVGVIHDPSSCQLLSCVLWMRPSVLVKGGARGARARPRLELQQ